MHEWEIAQKWETDWWGDCVNTLGEQLKQLLYAEKMGLKSYHNKKSPYNFNPGRISIVDLGGGPASLLLMCNNYTRAAVVDPLPMPEWAIDRYKFVGIEYIPRQAEQYRSDSTEWDECWIYNCLQHVENPFKVIENARNSAKLIRIFEWVNTPTNIGHLHSLSERELNRWLRGKGKVERINGAYNCFGDAYYGIFPTVR